MSELARILWAEIGALRSGRIGFDAEMQEQAVILRERDELPDRVQAANVEYRRA